jgi:hypothetical protein
LAEERALRSFEKTAAGVDGGTLADGAESHAEVIVVAEDERLEIW